MENISCHQRRAARTISGWCNPRHAMNGMAMLTKPDQSGWLDRSLFQQAWSASPRVSTRGGTDMGSASLVTGKNVRPA